MVSVLLLVNLVLSIFGWMLIISAVLSWLIAFNVVNTRNQVVSTVWDTLTRMTEPVLRPIRNVIPNLGGIDISPLVALLGVWLLQDLNGRYLIPIVQSAGL